MTKKKQQPILTLDNQEYHLLADIMRKGYSLLDALSFLDQDNTFIKKELEQGTAIRDILCKGKQNRFFMHLNFFLKVSSLSEAIDSALHMQAFETQIKKKLIKQCSYPAFLFCFAFVITLLFTRTIIPQMLTSFTLDQSFSILLSCMRILQQITIVLLTCMFIMLLGYIISGCVKEKRTIFISNHMKYLFFCKAFISYQFSGYLFELEQKGISSKAAMQYLISLRKDSLFYVMINHMNRELTQGIDLLTLIQESEYLNDSFKKMFHIGFYNDNMCDMLAIFMQQQEYTWQRFTKRIGVIVQSCAYTFITCMVLIVYQIMLVPLSMLETI